MAVDGNLIFNTKIDTDGIAKGEKEISSKIIGIKTKMVEAQNKAKALREELEKMADIPADTSASKAVENKIEALKAELEMAKKAFNKAEESISRRATDSKGNFDYRAFEARQKNDPEYKAADKRLEQLNVRLKQYQRELENVRKIESQTTGKDTAAYREKEAALERLSMEYAKYESQLREAEEAELSAANETSVMKRRLERTISALKLFAKGAAKAGSALKTAFSATVGKLVSNIGNHFKNSNHSANVLEKSLRRIKTMMVRMFFYRLVHSPLDTIKDGLGEISKISPELNKNLSALKTESTYLKNSLAAFAAPLVNLVTPALTGFMQTISGVLNQTGQLISVLTGQSGFTQAIKVQQDYAASLDESTKSTEKNTKAAKENQKVLAGFDELNVLNASDNDDSGTENAAATAPMFENVQAQVGGLAKTIADLFKNQDFNGLGKLVGDKINAALQKINWGEIKKTAKKWALNISNFLNGAIKETDWYLVGATLGESVNTALLFVKTFIENFDWKEAGKAAHDAIVSLFKTINWDDVSDIFAGGINGIVDFAIELIGDTDFYELGQRIGNKVQETIKKINWEEVGKLFTKLFVGAVDLIDGLVLSVKWEDFGKKLAKSFNTFFGENGGGLEFIKHIGKTLGDIVVGISDFIIGFFSDEKSAETFVNAVEAFFNQIPWLEILVKSLTGGTEIGAWVVKVIGDLVDKICRGLANAFSGSKDDPELSKAVRHFGISIANLLITVFEAALKILVNGIPNLLLGALKLVLTALAKVASLVMGEDWYNQATKDMESWKGADWTVKLPRVPYLATGTVIPANYGEFLAVLGDNKREAEVVSPVSAMKQAFLEALAEGGYSGGEGAQEINLYLDGDKLFTWLIEKNNRYQKTHGQSAFAGGYAE